jgi:LysR family positive regulator for ilvC
VDIDTLSLFVGLSRNLHFGKTSEQFHISPSALSRAMQRLEQDVGHRLLNRDNRSVSLTAQGEIFREFAMDTVTRYERLQVELGISERRLSGKLTLFASVTASQSILPNVLARFREEYPDIQIQLETGYAVNALQRLREGCDVVVAALSRGEDAQLVKRIIMSIPILTIAPAGKNAILHLSTTRMDWSRVPLILPSTGQARDNIDEWLRKQRIRPTIYSEVPGNEAILSLVALGCGVGFVPKLVLENSPLADKVRILRNGPALTDFHVGFCTRKRNLDTSPLVRAFWETI